MGYCYLDFKKKLTRELSDNWSMELYGLSPISQWSSSNTLNLHFNTERVCLHRHNSFKAIKIAVMPFALWSIDYSEGASSTPVHSSQSYQPIQYYKHLVPLHFQPDCQQKVCLFIISVQKCSIQVDTGWIQG